MLEDKIAAFARSHSNNAANEEIQRIPAATVILLRDSTPGMEILMLRKTSNITFGGMWVFPGGRIDDQDGAADDPMERRARIAAAREAQEEAALQVAEQDMCWFSHWTPPEVGKRRFITWFYAARAPRQTVTIDDGEIKESRWLTAGAALRKQAEGEIELAPPTFVTLRNLSGYHSVNEALSAIRQAQPRHYATRVCTSGDDLVLLWNGDAGYESGEADTEGPRHRLSMKAGGWIYEDAGWRSAEH